MNSGMYYLHTNGSLHWKPGYTWSDLDSGFVRSAWPVVGGFCKTDAWTIAVEARSMGVDLSQFPQEWNLCCEDGCYFIETIHKGKCFRDGDQWCATAGDFVDLQESPSGFGYTVLDAAAELCKSLGFKSRTMWGHTFKTLMEQK